jgi:hypothetical protein
VDAKNELSWLMMIDGSSNDDDDLGLYLLPEEMESLQVRLRCEWTVMER